MRTVKHEGSNEFYIPEKLQKKLVLIELISLYDEYEGSGGSLHVLLDDGNYGTAESLIDYAKKNQDFMGQLIATLLADFNENEQKQIVERPWEITEELDQLDKVFSDRIHNCNKCGNKGHIHYIEKHGGMSGSQYETYQVKCIRCDNEGEKVDTYTRSKENAEFLAILSWNNNNVSNGNK